MKILFVSWFPPSPRFSGSGLRTFHTLRALASCGQVTLFAPVQDRHRPLLEVPEVAPYLDAAGIVIAPIRFGGGTRIKILEAFAHRKAVVSTTTGCEGLAVEEGVHLSRADTPREFAAKCVVLMTDASMRRALGEAGRELVESHYSQDVFQRTVRRCVSDLVSSP